MVDVDEIPEEDPGVSRRAFVKGSLLAAAGLATAGTVGALLNSSFITSPAGKRFNYIGSTLVSGPAPQGVPLIPLKEENGVIVGNADFGKDDPEFASQIGSILEWYKYCGHAETPGLSADYSDPSNNKLRYFLLPEKVASTQASGIDLWYREMLGQDVKREHFRDVGYGAGFNWRSEGQSGKNILTGIVLRMSKKAFSYVPGPWPLGAQKFEKAANDMLVDLGDGSVLVAYISFCKHFCCVPGWQESPLARTQGFWSKMFCTCHFSVYDPVQLKGDYFIAETSTEKKSIITSGGGAGGH